MSPKTASKTTEVVRTVQNTVEIQDGAIVQMKETAGTVVQALQKQASHWGSFLSEMDRLEADRLHPSEEFAVGIQFFGAFIPCQVKICGPRDGHWHGDIHTGQLDPLHCIAQISCG